MQFPSTIRITSRISAATNEELFQQKLLEYQSSGAGFSAFASAAHDVKVDAEERLAKVLQAFSDSNPGAYADAMGTFGISLVG